MVLTSRVSTIAMVIIIVVVIDVGGAIDTNMIMNFKFYKRMQMKK